MTLSILKECLFLKYLHTRQILKLNLEKFVLCKHNTVLDSNQFETNTSEIYLLISDIVGVNQYFNLNL